MIPDRFEQLIAELERLSADVLREPAGFLAHPYVVPGGFYEELWDWDGYFISLHFARRGRPELMRSWALNFLDAADDTGYAPGCVTPEGPEPGLRSFQMKPFLAQGIAAAARHGGGWTWADDRYEEVVRIVTRRERTHFDPELGLFYWDSAMPSGADNNPAIGNEPELRGKIVSPDVNALQAEEYLALSEFCAHLGRTEEGIDFVRRADRVVKAMGEHLWSSEDGLFLSLNRSTGERVNCVSYSSFVPLWARHADLRHGRECIKRYLWNEEHMFSPHGIRSLSRQDPAYNNEKTILPHSNWQGPVWIVANWFYFHALRRYGFKTEAADLVERLARLCLRDIENCGSMHENYDAETGAPLEPCAEHSKNGREGGFVGWNLLLQDMIEVVAGLAPG